MRAISVDERIERLQRHKSFKKKLDERIFDNARPRLILAANRLTITLRFTEERTWTTKKSSGGLASGMSGISG